jgi:hypothetical protein
VRGFAVAGEPRFAHCDMQFLLIVSQRFPFDNGEHHSPHVGGLELLKKTVTQEQKVPGVFDLDLVCGRNSVQCGDFKQPGTKCGGHGKICAEIIRHRRRCDLSCATEERTAECCSASSVVFLRDFVVVVLATAGHGVCAGASGDESSGGALTATQTRRSEGSASSMRSGGLVQGRWDAAFWHGCSSTNDTKTKTRNSAAVRASPCPMAAGATSSEENPSSRRRTSAARLFESGKQAPMCIRACPGEASEENPSIMTNPEHRRGCAEKS